MEISSKDDLTRFVEEQHKVAGMVGLHMPLVLEQADTEAEHSRLPQDSEVVHSRFDMAVAAGKKLEQRAHYTWRAMFACSWPRVKKI